MARKRDAATPHVGGASESRGGEQAKLAPLIKSVSDTRRGHERGGVCLTRIAADDTLAKIRPRRSG